MEHQIECFCRLFTTQPFTGVFSTAHLAQVVFKPFFAGALCDRQMGFSSSSKCSAAMTHQDVAVVTT
jgi:hypothetical protein